MCLTASSAFSSSYTVVDGDDDADEVAEPQRYRGFGIALSRFANSGTRDDARKALGRWTTTNSSM
jgi:hypothetical protein